MSKNTMSTNTLTNYLDSIFDDFASFRPSASRLLSTTPAINIQEEEDKYVISVTIPGLDPNKITIEVVDYTLLISYEHNQEQEENDTKGKTIRREYAHYSFSRSISLPNNVDTSSIEAESDKGILFINIMKNPETKPKKINIKPRL